MPRQLARAAASINILTLCAEPKTSAPLTYFQLNAQILHRFSKACFRPAVALESLIEVSRQARCKVRCSLASVRDGRQLLVDCSSRHVDFSAWRQRASHVRRSISGLIPQFIAEGAARIPPAAPAFGHSQQLLLRHRADIRYCRYKQCDSKDR